MNLQRRTTASVRLLTGLLSALGLHCLSEPVLAAVQTSAKALAKAASAASPGLINEWFRQQDPAFSAWDVGGQFRLRYEDKDDAGFVANRDFLKSRDNDNGFLLLREKLHIGYKPTPWLGLYAEARNSTADFDKRPSPSPDTDKGDLHQAYVSLGDPKKFPVTLKAGRQELLYGDERFVGIGDWSNTGRVFDAAKLRFENDFLWADAFAGRVVVPRDNHFNIANDYDWFWGVYGSTRKLVPWQDTELYFLSRNVEVGSPNAVATGIGGVTARDIYTIGTRWKSVPGKLGGWEYSTELAGQFGSISSAGGGIDHEAFSADATVGYTWSKAHGTPRLGAGYTYASGDDDPNDTVNHTFEGLFGTNHKFYGVMDLWGLRNIHSARALASWKPWKPLTLSSEFHLIWLAEGNDFLYPESGAGRSGNGYGRNPQFSRFVGSELDIVGSYALKSYADLQLGYGHFFVGDYIKQSAQSAPANAGAVDANWVYVQLRINL